MVRDFQRFFMIFLNAQTRLIHGPDTENEWGERYLGEIIKVSINNETSSWN